MIETTLALLGAIFLTLGGAGVAASTFWFPLMARAKAKALGHMPPARPNPTLPLSLEVLIPAHNEAENIGRTIDSIQKAIKRFWKVHPEMRIWVTVGAGSCTDKTIEVARSKNVVAKAVPNHKMKWDSIKFLTHQSKAEWVVLVDADIEWPETLLLDVFLSPFWNRELLGVSPSFGSSPVWRFEAKLKEIENQAGGPVSVHGATVFYRHESLMETLRTLHFGNWINDDVVIPLTLRTQFPARELRYLNLPSGQSLEERPVRSLKSLPGRKLRMALGNLQWILGLLPEIRANHPVASLLAYRRVARMFFMYWLSLIALGLACLLPLKLSLFFGASGVIAFSLLIIAKPAAAVSMAGAIYASLISGAKVIALALTRRSDPKI